MTLRKYDSLCVYLIVIRERNDGGTHSQDHRWMDFTVCVGGTVGHALLLEVIWGHGQHHSLLLQSIDILHYTARYQVLPATHTHRFI